MGEGCIHDVGWRALPLSMALGFQGGSRPKGDWDGTLLSLPWQIAGANATNLCQMAPSAAVQLLFAPFLSHLMPPFHPLCRAILSLLLMC